MLCPYEIQCGLLVTRVHFSSSIVNSAQDHVSSLEFCQLDASSEVSAGAMESQVHMLNSDDAGLTCWSWCHWVKGE